MSFRVIERGTNQKLVYDLLLLVYNNFRRIIHRFLDTSCFNAENHIFAYPTCIWIIEGHADVGIWRWNLVPEN